MNNINYKSVLKTKKIELINSLELLGKNITTKIKAKNKTIEELKKNSSINDLDYIAKYKSEKNKEFDSLKSELNNILKDIDNIITNVTT